MDSVLESFKAQVTFLEEFLTFRVSFLINLSAKICLAFGECLSQNRVSKYVVPHWPQTSQIFSMQY